MSRRIACRWFALCLGLAGLAAGQGRTEDLPPTSSPVYPNFLVEVSRDFVHAAGGRSETKSEPISQNKDKIRTTGMQVTSIDVGVEFIPSATSGRVDLVLSGVTNAETDSRRGRIGLGHSTQLSHMGRISLALDENGAHELQGQAQPHLDYNNLKYLNAQIIFPLRPLVKRIAYRAYNKQKPKLDADITRDAGNQLRTQFNDEVARQIKNVNDRYVKDLRDPMTEKGVFPQRIRVMTSDHQIGIRALLNDPTGKPMKFAAVPDIHGWPDVALRVEESLLNNFTQGLFAGKTFSGEELDDEFNRLIGPLIGEVKTIEAGDKPFTITFPKEKPFEFRFYDQKFKVTLRGEEYTSGGRDFDGMDTTAVYKLRKTNVGLIAEREGDLVIYPPGFKPGVDKLGAREKVLQQILDRKFSKVFKPVFEMKEWNPPERFQNAGVLVTTQVESNKGWLTLGWRRQPQMQPRPPAPQIVLDGSGR